MPTPFKNLSSPGKNANALQQTRTVPSVPRENDPAVNEERVNSVPDHTPPIPWPAPRPVASKPMKGMK
jgi:hypothetical protein